MKQTRPVGCLNADIAERLERIALLNPGVSHVKRDGLRLWITYKDGAAWRTVEREIIAAYQEDVRK